nr:DUF11 domain-containing protein [Deinococcus sp.]
MLTGLLILAGQAAAARTPAGTQITNQAQAEFIPPTSPDPVRAVSNTIVTVVQAVCSVSVTPDGTVPQPGQSATLLPGEQAVFQYTVVNTGNTSGDFPVLARGETGSTISPALRVIRDLNGNGRPDTNEPEVSRVTLAPDDSAALLLVVNTSDAQGDAYVNLIASCAGGENADSNNVSRVQVGPPPVLGVQKSFTPALVRPGSETTVTVKTSNTGQGESREVILTDLLAEQAAQGLSFVAGSARTNTGTLEYTQDGVTWTAQEVTPVRGVRVRAERLAPGAGITLTFRMLAGAAAENQVIPNTATAQTGTKSSSGSASADVRYLPAVAIGPVGLPEAPENTPADSQSRPFAVVGQQVCFDHTVKNTGDVRDNFRVTVTYPVGTATSVLYGENGQPLAQPLVLDPAQTALVRICYDAQQVGPLESLITVSGDRGTRNTTHDLIGAVESGLPELTKSFEATKQGSAGQTVVIPVGGTVAQGDTITYTLTVRNPYTRPLTNAVVTDPIPAHVDFTGASDGGALSGQPGSQVVRWNLGTLAPGETRRLTVVTRVSTRAQDGEALKNIFKFVTTELTQPLPSNEVQTPVWTAKLTIAKTVSAREATYGDRLTYTLKITNESTTTAIIDSVVTDTPARGLQYIPGTSTLGAALLADPAIAAGVLTWNSGPIPAGGSIVITYQARVTPEAVGDLINTVVVRGKGAGGLASTIVSPPDSATTKLNPMKFAPVADIVGTVFVDRNRNGLFDPLLDTPVERARVLLAGGRQVVTDPKGRYSFPNVPAGTYALRLDPNTTPYPPLKVPQDGALSGTQTVVLRGLTSVDFPLTPLGGEISALRRTTLTVGDVTVEKAVYATLGGYVVTLRVVTPRALEGVQLTDPLPAGAVLKDGAASYTGALSAGERNFTYRFEWSGEPRAATTDPVISWRY